MSGSMKPGRKTISIHALREEGDRRRECCRRCTDISIHALREEGDCELMRSNLISISISIHALREEGDAKEG